MRLALIGPVYPYRGGIAHYTTLLAHYLSQRHEICLISFRRQYPSWLFPGRSDKDPSRKPLTIENAHYILDPLHPISWLYTMKLLRRFNPDALLVQWWVTFWSPSFATILHLYRRALPASPTIAFCHNIVPHENHWWDYLLAKRVLSLFTYHFVHSNQDKARLLDLVPDADINVVRFPSYEGIVSERFTRTEARSLLGLDPCIPVVLFFGFVRPYKGLMHLLRAVHKVRFHIPVHLLIAGEFWEDEREYLRVIEDLGLESCVTIVNKYIPNEEIGKYFDAANVLVLPYIQTSQSAVMQIALEMGVPVIASDTGGLRESIIDGVNGLLVKPGDAESLADALLRYLQGDLEAKLRKNIIEGQRERKDGWKNIVSKIETLVRTHYQNCERDRGRRK